VFDFFVVITTDVGILINFVTTFSLGSVALVIRTLRILRILRLIKKAKTLKLLIDTLMFIMPGLANIMLLLFLAFFIFTALGISLFGPLIWNDQINADANFLTLGHGLLTLLRGSTGESWPQIMWDCAETGYDYKTVLMMAGNFAAARHWCYDQT